MCGSWVRRAIFVWLTVWACTVSKTFLEAVVETFAALKDEDSVQTKCPRRLTISIKTELNRLAVPSTMIGGTFQSTVNVIQGATSRYQMEDKNEMRLGP